MGVRICGRKSVWWSRFRPRGLRTAVPPLPLGWLGVHRAPLVSCLFPELRFYHRPKSPKMVKLLRLTFGNSKVTFLNLLWLPVGRTLLVLPSFYQHPQLSQSIMSLPARHWCVSCQLSLGPMRIHFRPYPDNWGTAGPLCTLELGKCFWSSHI